MFPCCSVGSWCIFSRKLIRAYNRRCDFYARLHAFFIVVISTSAIVSTFVFHSLTPRLFVFLLLGEETAVSTAACYYCCTSTTTFPQCWSRQLAAHSFGPVLTARPEVDAHWSFVKVEERETPTNTFSPFSHFLFAVFRFPSFLMPPSVLSGFLRFVAAGSDGGGVKCRTGLYKLRRGERMDEKEEWTDTGHSVCVRAHVRVFQSACCRHWGQSVNRNVCAVQHTGTVVDLLTDGLLQPHRRTHSY